MFNNKSTALSQSLNREKISLGRLMCILSIVLFITGIGLDYVSTPELLSEILGVRLIMCTILASAYMLTYRENLFLKFYTLTISVLFLSSAFAIEYMIFITDPQSVAHSTYFAGLMLTIITVFMGTYITNLASIIISFVIIISFLFTSFYTSAAHFELAINNSFFLVSALFVGVISNIRKNKFLVDKLHLQHRLKEALRNQSDEIDKQSKLANFDSITNIPNRRYGTTLLEEMISDADALGMTMVVLFIDLNKFKAINDTYGHKAGDEILHVASARLVNAGRKADVLFRQGGDEFVYGMLLEKSSKSSIDYQIEKIIHSMRESLTSPIDVNGLTLSIDASIGKATYPYNGHTLQQLIEVADISMYKHKKFLKEQEENFTIPSIPSMSKESNVAIKEHTLGKDRILHMHNYNSRRKR